MITDIIIGVFLACIIGMMFFYENAMPYDPKWDEWEEEKKRER